MAPFNVAFSRQPTRARRPRQDARDRHRDDGRGHGLRRRQDRALHLEAAARPRDLHRVRALPEPVPGLEHRQALSPKLVIMDLRDELRSAAAAQRQAPRARTSSADDVLWACTTCGACVEQCPVDIEHVDAIIDMRRYEVLIESRFPTEAGAHAAQRREPGRPLGPRRRQAARVDRGPRLRGPGRRRHDPRRRRVPLLGRAAPAPSTSGRARPPSRSPACCTRPG